ncbi:MAG: AAA domain-containing protein [Clostridiales bacterium]|nr:AAA domain-containing protein [Clostridiales bacterium]
MDTRCNMIMIKGEIKTAEIQSCRYHEDTKKMDVTFHNGKTYSYAASNVEWLKEPEHFLPGSYRISKKGRKFSDIADIYVFEGAEESYWHICFADGRERDYRRSDLNIVESCLDDSYCANVFEYIKQIADLSDIKNEVTGEKLLPKRFQTISFVGNDVALARYLNPSSLKTEETERDFTPIFPFGCNNSQYKAVKRAMENQISVIQGPPGTGKTQTILNIIANILMQGKTVQVVSNNNSATENVYEKLSSEKYGLGFIVATLGNSENKKRFIEHQNPVYPDFSSWEAEKDPKVEEDPGAMEKSIAEQSCRLKTVFDQQEKRACLRQERSQLITEQEYFNEYVEKSDVNTDEIKLKKQLKSSSWMQLWQECQLIAEREGTIGFWFKIKAFFQYGMADWNFYKQDITKIITAFQAMYYRTRLTELSAEIEAIEKQLNSVDKDLLEDFCNQSMAVLKDKLAVKYGKNDARKIFSEESLWQEPDNVLEEYPVVLSTTFSSRSSLNPDVVYDYLIMDEASQVDIATGALALSCARNVVIVGDTRQLPNVVTDDIKVRATEIFDCFNLNEGYRFTKSFLQSILDVMPDVAQTLLREHYRCHPKIINFCNQKFYRGELIIMTTDKGEKDVLSVVKTVVGNHARNHYSQRQIDVIKKEIIPKYVEDPQETGIIAPYRNQVEALSREITDIDAATVHKFQGKEKDNIIISTVDDEISDFADDPYLINVAVSRAKKKLMLVVTGNEQPKERNITDLIDYIQYNNFEVAESRIYSVFDYLYKQYTEERIAYLKKYRKISEYDSENLMYSLIEDILSDNIYSSLDVVCHLPLNMLIKEPETLEEQERQYAMNPATHLDFLIYNRIGKKPVLAVEVDGYEYHKKDSIQASRDRMKDHIMDQYGIPLLRFRTNGSGEKEMIMETLEKLVG